MNRARRTHTASVWSVTSSFTCRGQNNQDERVCSCQPITTQLCLSLQTLTNRVPLRKQRLSPVQLSDGVCPVGPSLAPPLHLLLSD